MVTFRVPAVMKTVFDALMVVHGKSSRTPGMSKRIIPPHVVAPVHARASMMPPLSALSAPKVFSTGPLRSPVVGQATTMVGYMTLMEAFTLGRLVSAAGRAL